MLVYTMDIIINARIELLHIGTATETAWPIFGWMSSHCVGRPHSSETSGLLNYNDPIDLLVPLYTTTRIIPQSYNN